MARRRRRRPGDSADGLEELEDDDDLDIRVQSVEEELQNLSLSAAVAARDAVTMKNKLEKLARELEADEGDDEIFHEIDAVKEAINAQNERIEPAFNDLVTKVSQLGGRLENVGGRGTLEEFATRLEVDLSTALEQAMKGLEDSTLERLHAIETAHEQDSEFSASRFEDIQQQQDAAVKLLRDELGRTVNRLPDSVREQTAPLSKDFTERLETLASEVEATLTDLESTFQATLEATQQESAQTLESLRANLEASLAEVAEGLDSRAGVDQIGELQTQLQRLQSSFGNAAEVSERARQALQRINELERSANEQSERIMAVIKRSEEAARQVEQHSDKVSLAVKLVNQLEERSRTGMAASGGSGGPSRVPDSDLEAPEKIEQGFELKDLLAVMVQNEASELHLKTGATPRVRLSGDLVPVGEYILNEEDCRRLVFSALSRAQRARLVEKKALAFSYEMTGTRFKACAFVQRGSFSAAFKTVSSLASPEELLLPPVIKKLVSTSTRGLILLAGPPNSGKSTTLTSLVDLINQTRKMHVVTLEQPVGYYHEDVQSLITQQEVGVDTPSFHAGVREALYQDPDILVVDGVYDSETLGALLDVADGNRLVLATIEARTTVHAVRRLLELEQLRPSQNSSAQVAACLRVVVGQRLLPRLDQKGLVAAYEVLINTASVSQTLLQGKIRELPRLIENGTAEGLQSLSQSLQRLVEANKVSKESVAFYAAESQAVPAVAPAAPAPPASAAAARPLAPASQEARAAATDAVALPNSEDTLMNWL